jgi:hypothetical protein
MTTSTSNARRWSAPPFAPTHGPNITWQLGRTWAERLVLAPSFDLTHPHVMGDGGTSQRPDYTDPGRFALEP